METLTFTKKQPKPADEKVELDFKTVKDIKQFLVCGNPFDRDDYLERSINASWSCMWDKMYELYERINAHNSLPWYKRLFKKI